MMDPCTIFYYETVMLIVFFTYVLKIGLDGNLVITETILLKSGLYDLN